MLMTIGIILLAAWLLGLVAFNAGSIIHFLLVLAVIFAALVRMDHRGRQQQNQDEKNGVGLSKKPAVRSLFPPGTSSSPAPSAGR